MAGAEMSEGERGSFRYTNPAVVYYGAGCVAAYLDSELERLGARRVFLVTTRSVAAHPALAPALRRSERPRAPPPAPAAARSSRLFHLAFMQAQLVKSQIFLRNCML